jgi:hypothetical protein
MNNPHWCVVWPFERPCQMEVRSKVHCHFRNTKRKDFFGYLLVFQLPHLHHPWTNVPK